MSKDSPEIKDHIKSLNIRNGSEQKGQQPLGKEVRNGQNRKLYIESYGCQMNFSDSEIVTSIMHEDGFETISRFEEADVILINTCSIRDNAEQRVRSRLKEIAHGSHIRQECLDLCA